MKSVCRSVSELKTITTNHHRLLLLNLRSHYATKSTKPTKPLKPSDSSEPKPTTASTSPDSPPRSWTTHRPPPPPSPPPTSPPPSAADWATPGEIPFQAWLANSVNLIGYVQSPVRFHSTPVGSSWASTVITQKIGQNHNHNHDDADADDCSDSLPLW
ncbi:hypothetical protein TIFTF001_037248 [Ficus carica]|uniref:Uncharacterized protein n=1 Tax=Ficus carica TaxID=3494 RepID=A0AA88EGQ7_FICCA|nr:hypothetical protein TIFTF001_037248 [Ficus carica]